MSDLFPVSVVEMVNCVEREIRLREHVYPRRVSDKRMTQQAADRELRRMRAVLELLQRIHQDERRSA